MGLCIIVPGADYSAAPGKIGTVVIPNEDPLPILALAGLKNWVSAADVSNAGLGTLSIYDRVSGVLWTPTQAAYAPAATTINSQPALQFVLAGIRADPAQLQRTEYTWVYVIAAPATLTGARGLLGCDSAGPRHWVNSNGGITVNGIGGGTGGAPSTTGKVVANTAAIVAVSWDAVNGYGYSFNGVFDKYASSGTAPGLPVNNLIIGAQDQTIAAGWDGKIAEVFQFNRNMHAAANAGQFNYLLTILKAKYGL